MEKTSYTMVTHSTAHILKTILNQSHPLVERKAATEALIALLGKPECLQEVLDECCGRWRDLTCLLWSESDFAMKTAVSRMLAHIGSAAAQYAKLAGSVIPPNLLFAWIEPYLLRLSNAINQPWDETVILYMLDILRQCLSDLEGTAFRAAAPGLLNACLDMLGSKDTPIGHFGALLEMLVQLTKVPTCVRPKFREIIDLLVGWGVGADTPPNSRPSLSRAFQSLHFGWNLNADLAMSLVNGMAKDMTKLITSSVDESAHTEFLNTGLCLALILQSSSPYLDISALNLIPQVIQLHVDALVKYTPCVPVDDALEFVNDLCSQTRVLMTASMTRKASFGQGVQLDTNKSAQTQHWKKAMVASVLGILCERLDDPTSQPFMLSIVLHLHTSVISVLKQHSDFVEAEDALCKAYGEHGACFHLRMHSSKEVVRNLSKLYSTLSSWPTPRMRCFFIEILLRDLQPTASFLGHGGHGLPLLPPVTQEGNKEKNEIGQNGRLDAPREDESSRETSCADMKWTRKLIRRALFSVALMNQLVHSGFQGESNGDEIRRIWNITSAESLRSSGVLRHGIPVLKVLRLLRDSHDWLVANKISMKGITSAFEYMSSMIASGKVKQDVELTVWFLKWVKDAVGKSPAMLAADSRLVESILEFATSNNDKIRLVTGEIIHRISSACVSLSNSTVQQLVCIAANRSSDSDPVVSKMFKGVLTSFSSYALVIGSERKRRIWDAKWDLIATQRQTVDFQPAQLTSFLQHLSQVGIGDGSPLRLLQDPKLKVDASTPWITMLLESLSPIEGPGCSQSETFGTVVSPHSNGDSTQTMLWFLVHEAARNCVNTKFRLQNGGPSQFFSMLEGALSSLTTKLSRGLRVDFTNAWMLLEFISALEKLCHCGYEGSDMLPPPPESTWHFYLGNRKVFVDWFSRLHQKLLHISQKLGHHHFTVNILLRRIHQLGKEQGSLMENTIDEAWGERLSIFLSQLSELLMQATLSLCKLHEPAVIQGVHHHIVCNFSAVLLQTAHFGSSAENPVGWLRGLALQASGRFEDAVFAYNEFYTYARSVENEVDPKKVSGALSPSACHKTLVVQLITKEFQPFVRERIAECFYATADWKGYRSFVQVIEQQEPASSALWSKLRRINLSSIHDLAFVDEALEKLSQWVPESPPTGVDEVSDLGEVLTLQALLSSRAGGDPLKSDSLPNFEMWMCKQSSIVQMLAHDSPRRLATHLLSMHKLKSAFSLAEKPNELPGAHDQTSNMFDIVTRSRLPQAWQQLGILSVILPDAFDIGLDCQIVSNLSVTDIIGITRVLRTTNEHNLAPLSLLGCHLARKKSNKRLAGRFLNDEALQSGLTSWLRALAIVENREMLMSGCSKEDSAKFLVQWWDSTQREIQEVATMDDTSRMILSVSLSRLSSQLASANRNEVVAKAIRSFGTGFIFPNQFCKDQWSLIEAAMGGPLEHSCCHGKDEVMAAQAFCTTAALGVSPQLPVVWKNFGHILCAIMKQSGEQYGPSAVEGQESAHQCYRHALQAFCKYWQLKGEDSDSFILLRMLRLIHEHGHYILDENMRTSLASVPSTAWVTVTSQLFMKTGHQSPHVRQCMTQLLKEVSKVAIASVLYPAVVERRKAQVDSTHVSHEMEVLLAGLQAQQPQLWKDLDVMLDEMERLTMLWVQQWHATLSDLHLDMHRRCVTFKAEIGRLQSNESLDEPQRTAIVQQRFAALFSPVFLVLERRLRSTLSKEPQTPNEQEFYDLFAGQLTTFIGKMKDMVVLDVSQIQLLWAPIKGIIKAMDALLKKPHMQLGNVSPILTDFSGTDVPMPGFHGDKVTVCGFGPNILLLSTKTRPKKLEMIGSDGKEYSFLLKGRDDLHMDQRLMQFVSCTNSLLRKDQQTGWQEYSARDYSVTPLGARVGLVQWVPQTISLYGIFRSWQTNQVEKREAVNSAQDPESKTSIPVPTAASMRPTDLYYSNLFPELRKARIMLGTASRKEWPTEVMLKVFKLLQEQIPEMLLANELWCGSSSSSSWWARIRNYVGSTSVMSMIGYILGLGDRHLDNLLIDKVSGEVVHIDYDICFEKGTNSRIPEVVPFRMTRTMQMALGIGGIHGSFHSACVEIMRVLRENKEGLWMLVDAILNDPSVDWAADRHERAARKGMDLAVNLQLFKSRYNELQGSLSVPRQRLLVSLDTTAECCQVSLESHTSMNKILRNSEAAKAEIVESQRTISEISAEQLVLSEEMATAQGLHDNFVSDLQAIQESIQQVVSHCRQWVSRHNRLLETLRDSESPMSAGNEQKWLSKSTPTPLDLVQRPTQTGNMSVVDATFGRQDAANRLAPELLQECTDIDEEGSKLLASRDALLLTVQPIILQYVEVLCNLMSPNYLTTSHHHAWMLAFSMSLSGGLEDGKVAAEQLVAREQDDRDLLGNALAKAYGDVSGSLKVLNGPDRVCHKTKSSEEDASVQCALVQQGLLCDWSVLDVCIGLEFTLKEFQADVVVLLEKNESNRCDAREIKVQEITKKVFGLAHVFRLLKPTKAGQVISSISHPPRDIGPLLDTSTGVLWLDALEQYVTSFSLAIQSLASGLLLDLKALIELGPLSTIKHLFNYFNKVHLELKKLAEKSWAYEDARSQHADFLSKYDSQVHEKLQAIQEVSMQGRNIGFVDDEIQDIMERQQGLADHLQEIQSQYENRDSVEASLADELQGLLCAAQRATAAFTNRIMGIAHTSSSGDYSESEDDFLWGDTFFSVFHACLEPFNLMESAESHLRPFMKSSTEPRNVFSRTKESLELVDITAIGFSPGLSQYTCHFEHVLLLRDILYGGFQERLEREDSGEIESHTTHAVDDVFVERLNERLQRVIGSVFSGKAIDLIDSLRDYTRLGSQSELLMSTEAKSDGFEGPRLLNGDGYMDSESTAHHAQGLGESMIIQRISQSFQACLEAQGDFAHSTLVQRSQHVWMETINKRQIVRMRNLSAYLWDNVDKLQENAEMSSNGLCLQTNFDDLSNSEIPQMNCPRKAACRSQILADLELSIKSLSDTQNSILDWTRRSEDVSHNLYIGLQGNPGRLGGNESDADFKVLQGYLNHRIRWLDSSNAHVDTICCLVHALLQFEYSRKGLTWNPGCNPTSDLFDGFSDWMKQLCTNMEQIEATRMRMDEIRSKSSELSLRAGHAQSVLQSAEAREALLSQAYNENIVPHLLSVKNVAQSIGDLMEGLKASRTSIEQDLGSLLRELADITSGYDVTKNAHEVASRVLAEYAELQNSIEKVASLAPHLCKKLGECVVDPSSGFEVLGSEASQNELVQLMLQDKETFTMDLEELRYSSTKAVLSLGNIYNALESLIDATNSIAAALESEHGLGIEASDLDQQLENVKFNQVSEDQSGGPLKGSSCSDSGEEAWVSTRHVFKTIPKQPVNVGTQLANTSLCGVNQATNIESNDEPAERVELAKAGTSDNSSKRLDLQPDPVVTDTKEKAGLGFDDSIKLKISHTLNQEQQMYVESVSAKCLAKLEGESSQDTVLSVENQVKHLLEEATDPRNLCRMYEGWTAWI